MSVSRLKNIWDVRCEMWDVRRTRLACLMSYVSRKEKQTHTIRSESGLYYRLNWLLYLVFTLIHNALLLFVAFAERGKPKAAMVLQFNSHLKRTMTTRIANNGCSVTFPAVLFGPPNHLGMNWVYVNPTFEKLLTQFYNWEIDNCLFTGVVAWQLYEGT